MKKMLDQFPKPLFDEFALIFEPRGCSANGLAGKDNPRVILHGDPRTVYGQGFLLAGHVPFSKRIEILSYNQNYNYFEPHFIELAGDQILIDSPKELSTCKGCHTGRPNRIGNQINDPYALRPNWDYYQTWRKSFGMIFNPTTQDSLFTTYYFESPFLDTLKHNILNNKSFQVTPSKSSKSTKPHSVSYQDSIYAFLDTDKFNSRALASMNGGLNKKINLRNGERISNILVNSCNIEKNGIGLLDWVVRSFKDKSKEEETRIAKQEELDRKILDAFVKKLRRDVLIDLGAHKKDIEYFELLVEKGVQMDGRVALNGHAFVRTDEQHKAEGGRMEVGDIHMIKASINFADSDSTFYLMAEKLLGDNRNMIESFHTVFHGGLLDQDGNMTLHWDGAVGAMDKNTYLIYQVIINSLTDQDFEKWLSPMGSTDRYKPYSNLREFEKLKHHIIGTNKKLDPLEAPFVSLQTVNKNRQLRIITSSSTGRQFLVEYVEKY